MIATHPRRHRADDRAPMTTRITWAYWRAVSRLEREAPAIVGFCGLCLFYVVAAYTVSGWLAGK